MWERLQTAAAYLYDGGWRAADREELRKEYCLSSGELDTLCFWLREYEGQA